ncbi:hypothetical protein GCM10010251_35090 [Streptomyces aurantiogriseus]|uniref:Uncharacterized protein n=1 Tax=Streptomyces aurantiogriseus TaxID=66870 RepID=A0A918CBK9_9ACTN|nr:hypothetical protein GCM10010251_35090 [Streptomyces aurantiogriseus]
MLGMILFVLPFIHAKQLGARGTFSVSPKSLTVNTITPRIGGQPWGAQPETAALRLLRGPQGVAIILACGACHRKRFLATTCSFLLGAVAGGMPLRFSAATGRPVVSGPRSRRSRRVVCPISR